MRIVLQNILGLENLTLAESSPKFVVGGPNAIGKTSLATAVAAAVTGEKNPLGFSAAFVKNYAYNDDLSSHSACLVEYKGESYSWAPGKEPEHSEKADIVHPGAVGLIDFLRLTPKESKTLFESLTTADSDALLADIEKQLLKIINPASAQKVIKKLRGENGWDSTIKEYESYRKDQATLWRGITGQVYGTNKGAKYKPEGWSTTLDGLTPADTAEALKKAQIHKDNLQEKKTLAAAASQNQAISKEEVKEALNEINRKRQATINAENKLNQFRQDASPTWQKKCLVEKEWAELNSLQNTKNKPLPPNNAHNAFVCPSCQENLYIIKSQAVLQKDANKVYKEELGLWEKWQIEHKTKLDAKQKEMAAIISQWEKLDKEGQHLKKQVEIAGQQEQDAVAIHDNLKKREANQTAEQIPMWTDDDYAELREAEQSVMDRANEQALVNKYLEAKQLHDNWITYDAILCVLGPDGARKDYVQAGLNAVNKIIDGYLQNLAPYKISIKEKGDIFFGYGDDDDLRPAQLASTSERWITDAIMRLAVAELTDSWLCLIDAADTIDQKNYEIFKDIVYRMPEERRVMICMTLWDADIIESSEL